jgi:hypothetical protein
MSVELILEQNLWDAFIEESNSGQLAHKWMYLKIIERHTGFKLYTYGIYKKDVLIGVMPFFLKRFLGLNVVFSPPPKTATPYLGLVLFNDYDNYKQFKREKYLDYLLGELETVIKSKYLCYSQISLVPEFLDMRYFRWNNYNVDPCYTMIIDLSYSLEELWNNFHKDLRNKLRVSEKKGFVIQQSEDVSMIYEMLNNRYKEQKMSSALISLNYLNDLKKEFPKNIKIYYILNENGEIISATATQEYKNTLVDWLGSTKTVSGANEYMEWELIKYAKSLNYRLFDFAGANKKSISTFKSKFNPKLYVSYNVSKKNVIGRTAEWAYLNFVKKRSI